MTSILPEQFRDLEQWSPWFLATERERHNKRIQSSMDELRAFAGALKPRMEDLIQHLSAFAWGSELTDQQRNLFHLGLSYMEAAVPLDLGWKAPAAEDSFPVELLQTMPVR
jgi:hypothetical protein